MDIKEEMKLRSGHRIWPTKKQADCHTRDGVKLKG
jgi:hypothetical protein